ncbi:hypothetical protein BHE74_00058692 [Ensete ventricosum]|nr:hypothetical protein BHE74_00058692 [Ensete ventricosum]
MSKTLREAACRVEFRSIFHAPYRKFKILAIPDLLAYWKSYVHDFMKKRYGHKFCAKSRSAWSFDWFFLHRLGNSKYWHARRISPWEVERARFRKKTRQSYTLRKSRAESSFKRFLVHHPKN